MLVSNCSLFFFSWTKVYFHKMVGSEGEPTLQKNIGFLAEIKALLRCFACGGRCCQSYRSNLGILYFLWCFIDHNCHSCGGICMEMAPKYHCRLISLMKCWSSYTKPFSINYMESSLVNRFRNKANHKNK